MDKKCIVCGGTKGLKRGWTNAWYDSENCERRSVSELHDSMPGSGPLPRAGWMPYHISREIANRWATD